MLHSQELFSTPSPVAFILETHFFFYQDGDAAKPENNPRFIQGSQVLLSKPPFFRDRLPIIPWDVFLLFRAEGHIFVLPAFFTI